MDDMYNMNEKQGKKEGKWYQLKIKLSTTWKSQKWKTENLNEKPMVRNGIRTKGKRRILKRVKERKSRYNTWETKPFMKEMI